MSTALGTGRTQDRLVADTLIYLAGRSVPAVLMIVSVPVFARTLGPDAYGLYALYAALALTAGNTAGAWIGQAVLRFASRLQLWTGGTLEHALNRALVGAILGAFGVTFLASALLPWTFRMSLAAAFVAASMAAYAVTAARQQAALRAGRVSRIDVVRVVLTLGLPALAMFGLGLRDPVVLLVGAAIGNCIGAGLLLWERPVPSRTPARTQVALRQMMAFGAPVAGWMLVSTLLNLSDRYLIERLIGTAEVGSYAAVYDLVFKGVVFLFTPVLLAAHPMIMDAWNRGDEDKARSVLRRGLTYSIGAGALITLGVWLLAPLTLPIVLGAIATEGSLAVAGPVAAGAFLWQVAMLAHKPLELHNRTGLMLLWVSVALATNVAVNLIFLPLAGVIVAGYSTVLSAFLYLALVVVSERWMLAASTDRRKGL